MAWKMKLATLFAVALPLAAQSAQESRSKSTETGITREDAAKIIQELQMIRMLLQKEADGNSKGSPAPPLLDPTERKLPSVGQNILGSADAPLTLVEFVDLQCSFCIQFHNEVFPELRRKYIDTGKLRFAVIDFPLPSHTYALPAAILARCAGLQGKYWQVHDAFLSEPIVASPDQIQKIANEIKLESKQLNACLTRTDVADSINRESELARQVGVFGTPTFLLGHSQSEGALGRLMSFSTVESGIEELLRHETSPVCFSDRRAR